MLKNSVASDFIKKFLTIKKRDRWGLVLEGGAMRCIFTAGVLDAIQESGLDKFDYCIGVSAGTGCAMSFIADQKGRSHKVFVNYLSSNQFVDFRRFLKGDHIMDLGYAIREINEKLLPINFERFHQSKTEFYTVLTDAYTGEPFYIKPEPHEVMDSLVATCNLPYLTKAPAIFRGEKYVDGGVATPIPLQKALELGANKLVVISTRPRGYRKTKSNFLRKLMGSFFNEFSHLQDLIANDYVRYNRDKSFLENFDSDEIELIVVEPPANFPVDRLTTKRETLLEGYAMGVIEGLKLSQKLREVE